MPMAQSDSRVVSVVVPVYYNSSTLRELLRRLKLLAAELPHFGFEFVFVDDGSGDDSFAVLAAESLVDDRIRALRLSRNFGSNAAILAGLNYARGDCTVVIAADLQDPPELIPELLEHWDRGSEIVLAARRKRDDPWPGRLAATVFNRLFRRFVFPNFPRNGFDFMLVSRRVANILTRMSEKNSYIFGQVMWVGFNPTTVYYDRAAREFGQSRWTFTKKIKYFIDAFSAFSYLPVRAASLLGLILALSGFMYAALLIVLRLLDIVRVPGFSALMVVLLLTSGTQLIVTGAIGEYLWRVLEEARNRPPFVVAASINVPEHESEDHQRVAVVAGTRSSWATQDSGTATQSRIS
jgi:polyisoprenyl-phosphate glycosyltransferase